MNPKPKISNRAAETEISEIFSSIQGEGPYLGVKQVFVRFGRCNMHCGYCDELDKMKEERFSRLSLESVLAEVRRLEKEKGAHQSVSLTGGEPLFYAPFLANLLPRLKEMGLKTYLETNGTLPAQLRDVIRWIDIVAMDLKPPSSTGDKDYSREHWEFMKIALEKELFTKLVVTPATTFEDVRACVHLVKSVNARLPFIFQPLSEPFGINTDALKLIETRFFAEAKTHLFDVRVIPQMHKIWGVR